MLNEILIYLLIFVIGFMVGRIFTTIRLGAKFREHFEKIKAKYEKKTPSKK